MRSTFIQTLTEMARKDERIMCVIGDTGYSVFEDFEKEFPKRFVNVGIAEQNFVGFGAGLAAMGMKPYIYNVVSFMTERSFEEIALDICYQENPVVLVGVGGGHAYGVAGPTHHGNFDIALMRLLPNMTVVCPADPVEMRAVMLLSQDYGKPLYIRIGRSVDPVVHKEEIDFQIGKAIQLREGSQAVLFATGTMVKDAVKTVDALKTRGIEVSLYSMHTIKPIDAELIRKCAKQYNYIFTLEEHSVIGGLGDAVAEELLKTTEWHGKFVKLGVPDAFAPTTGTREYLHQLYGIDPEGVEKTIADVVTG